MVLAWLLHFLLGFGDQLAPTGQISFWLAAQTASIAAQFDGPFWTVERLLAIQGFALASTWTPGPNNMMLSNSGATFGFRRSYPHMLGVIIGAAAMVFVVALGLGEAFQSSALLRETLKWCGAALLLYIAWRVATAGQPQDGDVGGGRPFTFLEAFAFQVINPKVWMMSIGVSSAYLSGAAPLAEAVAIGVAFIVSNTTSAHGWTAFGAAMREWLAVGGRLRIFNLAMGIALALFVIPILWI